MMQRGGQELHLPVLCVTTGYISGFQLHTYVAGTQCNNYRWIPAGSFLRRLSLQFRPPL